MNGVRHHTWFSSALSSCYMVFARISEMEWLLSNSEIEFLYLTKLFWKAQQRLLYFLLLWWLEKFALMTWLYYKNEVWGILCFLSPKGQTKNSNSFFSLLDKLLVSCPNADSCQEQVQRGNLDDHLRYRCSGTLVACQFAASGGCDYRGPKKTMAKHQTECRFKKEGKT